MDHKSHRLIKESYLEVRQNQSHKLQEQQAWKEVQEYANYLVNEGYDLSDMTWDEVYEAYLEEQGGRSGDFRLRQRKEREAERAAKEAERKKNNDIDFRAGGGDKANNERKGANSPSSTERNYTQSQTRNSGRSNLYKGGGGDAAVAAGKSRDEVIAQGRKNFSSSQTSNTKKETEPAKTTQTTQQTTQPSTQRTAAQTPAKQTGDKAKDMASWAKANPKLAAAKARRDKVKATNASSNPLMKDMKTRMPKPTDTKSIAKTTPSTTGNKASKFMSPGGSKATAAVNKPSTKPDMRTALASVGKQKTNESADAFDARFQELVNSGFPKEVAIELMVYESTKHVDEKKEARKKNRNKIRKVELCPTIDESILDVVFDEWIEEMVSEGYDLSESYESDLFNSFLTQISEDTNTYHHLEFLGRVSLEEATKLSVEDQMRVSRAYFAKRNARSDEEKEDEKKKDARSRSERSAMHAKPDPYKSRGGESD